MKAELTQQQVAEIVGTTRENVSDIIAKCGKNCKNAEFTKTLDFTPFLYNLWNSSKDNKVSHFGKHATLLTRMLSIYKETAELSSKLTLIVAKWN